MYDEGQHHGHPYLLTKFEAEGLVRRECTVPFRIYRPGIVIGSSQTGEADKVDGPYYAFKAIQRVRAAVPAWMPMIGLEGGKLNLVPVDYVAGALDHIAHLDGLDGRTFHLTDPKPLSFGDAMNEFCKAAHAPQFTARIDSRAFALLPQGLLQLVGNIPVLGGAARSCRPDPGVGARAHELAVKFRWPDAGELTGRGSSARRYRRTRGRSGLLGTALDPEPSGSLAAGLLRDKGVTDWRQQARAPRPSSWSGRRGDAAARRPTSWPTRRH
jgi:hypothetical protein